MLKNLVIKNYALIRHLNIDPSTGLNMVTGETGAGKSIMIGAIGLLLGNRADTKVLYNKSEKCVIEGLFNIKEYDLNPLFNKHELDYDRECIIRREIMPSGKSRAFINDTPVTLDIMREHGINLMDIHSQNDNLKLGSGDFQLQIIDTYLQNQDPLGKYRSAFSAYKTSNSDLKKLLEEAEQIRKEADYNHFLFEELDKANLSEDEQEILESDLQTLEHAEEIKTQLYEVIGLLNGSETSVIDALSAINRILQKTGNYSAPIREISERLDSSFVEIKDIARDIEHASELIEHDPEKISSTRDKLDLIYKLEQKHQVSSVTELLKIQEELAIKIDRNLNLDSKIEKLTEKVNQQKEKVITIATEISGKRKAVFPEIKKNLETLLKGLGMPEAKIEVSHTQKEPSLDGIDEVRLLFSANKGVAPKDLKQVASGGEFSRLMFGLKYVLASKSAMPTLILDEIDSGVSGEIAIQMAKMMHQMSRNHQLIVITHLPQIAAHGEEHYFVFKDNSSDKTVSKIRSLNKEDRVLEIAKMIGGDNPTESAFENAKELLGNRY